MDTHPQIMLGFTKNIGMIYKLLIKNHNLKLILNSNNNYPNPFNSSTNISFSILKEGFVNIVIYNVNGVKMKLLTNEYKRKGNYTIKWNGQNENGLSVQSGVYFCSIQIEDLRKTKKMILLK